MSKKIILMFILVFQISLVAKEGVAGSDDRYITKQELMEILKTIFPEKVNIRIEDLKKRNDLYNKVFPKAKNTQIISMLKRYVVKNNDEEVILRCNYLLKNRKDTLKLGNELWLLNKCSEYDVKYYEYKGAIEKLNLLLEKNNGEYKNKDILNNLLKVYKLMNDKDKIRDLENILRD